MKKLAVLLLLLAVPIAYADWNYNSKEVTTQINIHSESDILERGPGAYVDTASVNLTFFPRDTSTQDVLEFQTNPYAEQSEKALVFKWQNPSSLNFEVYAEVKTINEIIPVREKILFPIKDIPKELVVYTMPSATIDSDDDDIIRLASEIAEGEDDLYEAVFKVADWTKNNINYNLSTLTADVSQKASWVLQNKKGVCDELTSLFIAMLRSLGIPARFVSGISYTNSELFTEKWGPHGWAEVYFPNHGWIPFDVTYGEFGWIDPTHIKFKDSIDSDEPSTYFQWLGRNADIETGKLEIKTELKNSKGNFAPALGLDADAMHKSVSFGSYNLIEAIVENKNDFYYSTELYVNRPAEVLIVGSEVKSILLRPYERKKIYWIAKVSNLNKAYTYTFPVAVKTINNISSETSFASDIRAKSTSLQDVQKIASLIDEEGEKTYSGNVDLICDSAKLEYYNYEDIRLDCRVKNTGNVYLENLKLCHENDCENFNLGISQTKGKTFKIVKVGQVTLQNNLVSKSKIPEIIIKDEPKISIEIVEKPEQVFYDKNFTVSFLIKKESGSNPKNILVLFDLNGVQRKWNFDEIRGDRQFILSFQGRQLEFGENNFKIDAFYLNDLGKKYSNSEGFEVNFTNVTITQRIVLMLNSLGNMGSKSLIMLSVFAAVLFVLAILIVFKAKE